MNHLAALLLAGTMAAQPPQQAAAGQAEAFRAAARNGGRSEEIFRRTRRMMNAWLAYADQRTLLLPDVVPGFKRGPQGLNIYRPHNSGADNYPYLVATAFFSQFEKTGVPGAVSGDRRQKASNLRSVGGGEDAPPSREARRPQPAQIERPTDQLRVGFERAEGVWIDPRGMYARGADNTLRAAGSSLEGQLQRHGFTKKLVLEERFELWTKEP